ncbi:unnamed protein product [Rotaria socialis]|uniref:ETS domain-containing protein n=2 Tax=Rotaria socialis TaxID=392032 RepID=A0A818VZ84_9BILA|nr:unnamed protein product [Rotaria socialis]CAF3316041.1 unnamed protein product [Rotaria socialis]CAF3717555.1 unnamed protein product [Rotaria socialis]CAF4113760.1 unnamed protein product [Rotaria socialis]CAF4649511.1 unnamed protein product [Rotaria socialis]
MSRSEFVSQPSCDLSIYLPNELNIQESENYQSVETLMRLFGVNPLQSSHRMDVELFDPLNNDTEALLLTDETFSSDVKNFKPIDFSDCFFEESKVIPHLSTGESNLRPNDYNPSSPSAKSIHRSQKKNASSSKPFSSSSCDAIKKFLVYDVVTGRLRRPLLHEFIRLLVEYDEYSDVAEYLDRKRGIFKLHKPEEVAELWKNVKGRNSDNNMTYDKLARALRYYYGNGIMHPSPGRFTFRFGLKSGFGTSWGTIC